MTHEQVLRDSQAIPMDEAIRPTDLRLDRRDGLSITWADGRVSHYPLPYLRKRCPCATCRAETPPPAAQAGGLSLNILPANIEKAAAFADARLVGHYAIQITWQDGHSTGIYDFRYLREIAPPSGARD